VPEAYVQAVLNGGGCPVIIPLGQPEAALRRLLSSLDGVLFTGGGDVAPERYGSQPHPKVDGVDLDRDRVEIQLLQDALQKELPFLGICRGLQVINVATGGSLYEDLVDQHPAHTRHQFSGEYPRDYLAHEVQVDPASRLAGILGSTILKVNSLHHQGIRSLAPRLQSSALSPDGVVEAIELPSYPFGMAVQWHPECLPDMPEMQALFRAFVFAARNGMPSG
jgi:putative glutamine amidotransferase